MNSIFWIWTVSAFWTIIAAGEAESENGYIFTSPRSLQSGTNNELHLRRFGKLDPGVLIVQVFYSDYSSPNETLAVQKEFEIPAGESDSFLQLYLQNFANYVYNGKLKINGTFGDYKIYGTDDVSFSTAKSEIVLIQTDKPIYKPGQQVKFRVLKLEKDLKPYGKNSNIFSDIYVEDPKSTRLFQYKNVDLSSGIIQNEFPLSEEPVKGTWRINVNTNGTSESTTFEVKEYVLPKFDVSIKFPSFVLANSEEIPIEICAKYTYGKPVVGILNLNSSLEKYSYSREKYPTVQETIKIDGCYNYSLNVSLIQGGSNYRYRRIMVVANVIENGTGVDRNETQYLQRQYSPLNLIFSNDQRQFFKPGLPFNGKLLVYNPDETPAAKEIIELCAIITKERVLAEWWATKKLKFCKNYTSDAEGLIPYTVPSQNTDVVSIQLEAKSMKYAGEQKKSGNKQVVLNVPQASMTLNPYYSPSGSFIQLQPVDETVQCDTMQSFKLLFTSKENADLKFYYQITKQADVILADSLDTSFSVENDVSGKYENDEKVINGQETKLLPLPGAIGANSEERCPASKESKYLPPVGEVNLEVNIDASLSPTFYILVYYIRGDRETVADSQRVNVEKCFKNKVDFKFGDKMQQPGLKTSIQITASPNSLCGIKTVDKSVLLLNSNDQLTKDSIFRKIENMDTNNYYTSNPCYRNTPQPGLYSGSSKSIMPPVNPTGSTSYDDSLSAFQSSGFLVISDLILFTRPCSNSGSYDGGFGGGSGGPGYQAESLSFDSAVPVALSAARRPAAAALGAEAKVGISATKSVSEVRTFFPETWLFDLEMTGPDGIYVAKERLPDTITEWIGSAVCINAEDGFGISNSTSITAFQAFFLDYTLPTSVIRGEEFVVVVSIFSYANGALPITLTLDHLEGIELTSDSINGDVCVQPDTSESLKIKLKATSLGKINITVRAETASSSEICGSSDVSKSVAKDAITKSLDVEAEGFPLEKVFNTLFCPSDSENGLFEKAVALSLPEDIVPDSSRAYIDFTGNVLGKAIDNLDSLVTLPTGCGEQNMVKFTPNYLVLDFLKDIGMLTEEIERKAKNNLNKGYQRELTYRHNDGSFSAFGEVDKDGSMFLTAFVLRSFYEAKRYISIDDNILRQMQLWIISKQQADGCFPDVGKIIDIELQGGIEKEKSSGSITAYALASLLISKYANKTNIDSAFSCLESNPPSSPYGALLYAYAEALASKTEKAQERFNGIKGSVNKTEGMEFFIIANSTESIRIEASAYAILTTLYIGGSTSDALPFVRYLTAHLNPNGGFKSTQDTCVGLDALSQFARLVYKDPLHLEISATGGLDKSIELTDDNKLLVQRFKASKVPSEVNFQAKGTGCGLIQTSLRYNLKTPPKKMNFFLDVSGECNNENCKQASVNVIVSYLPPGLKAGMTIVEIKLLTGTAPLKESLEKLTSNKSSQILRYDVENNNVVLYFSEMSNAGQMFSFQIERVVEVENSQPGSAKVYDYYANENSATTDYRIKGLTTSDDTVEKEVE